MKLDSTITVAVTALAVVATIVLLLIKSSSGSSQTPGTITRDGKTLYMVKSFHYVEPGQITCQAIMPECGYCPGEVVDKLCYAEKSKWQEP